MEVPTNTLTNLSFHLVSDHVQVVRGAGPLNVRAVKPSLYRRAVTWSVESIQEAVFALIVANSRDLQWVLRHYCLVDYSVQLEHVLPVGVYLRSYCWLQDLFAVRLLRLTNEFVYFIQ